MSQQTDSPTLNQAAALSVATALLDRARLGAALGKGFGGDRDYYQALGYPRTLTFDHYLAQYSRHPVAGKAVDYPAMQTWRTHPDVVDGDTAKHKTNTRFARAWRTLATSLRLWHYCERTDRLAGIGEYAILVIGTRGGALGEQAPAIMSPADLLYFRPYSQGDVTAITYDMDQASPRFGLPLLYTVNLGTVGAQTLGARQVHFSHVVHVAEDTLTDEVFGRPRLQRPYNLLDDIIKIAGGSAEATWKLVYKGAVIAARDGFDIADSATDLAEKADEYIHGLRRVLTLQGADLNVLGGEAIDPSGIWHVLERLVSAATDIPARLLFGSERGELASSQDQENYAAVIQARRERFAEPVLVRPLVDWMLAHSVIPQPSSGQYAVVWPSAYQAGDAEIVDMNLTRAQTAEILAKVYDRTAAAEVAGFSSDVAAKLVGGAPPE